MKKCVECEKVADYNDTHCRRCFAKDRFFKDTGLTMDDLPEGLPIEDFIDENGHLDYQGMRTW